MNANRWQLDLHWHCLELPSALAAMTGTNADSHATCEVDCTQLRYRDGPQRRRTSTIALAKKGFKREGRRRPPYGVSCGRAPQVFSDVLSSEASAKVGCPKKGQTQRLFQFLTSFLLIWACSTGAVHLLNGTTMAPLPALTGNSKRKIPLSKCKIGGACSMKSMACA